MQKLYKDLRLLIADALKQSPGEDQAVIGAASKVRAKTLQDTKALR